jgi:hypothetical protein
MFEGRGSRGASPQNIKKYFATQRYTDRPLKTVLIDRVSSTVIDALLAAEACVRQNTSNPSSPVRSSPALQYTRRSIGVLSATFPATRPSHKTDN